ncbi:MAG TPA: BLUF domain-containing protein [Bacteroidales bacterium]|nr:BLUF domain-containing protein [Bacteroidales bacterium]
MKDLIHIVYVSFSVNDLTEKNLEDLLVDIRKRNKLQKVTGLLLYNDGTFIQLIEGKTGIIQNLFEKIQNDRRHSNVVLLLEESIKKRAFPDWTMGYYKLNREQSGKIPGYSDFMLSKDSRKLIESTSYEAMKLLNSFKAYI